MKKVIRLTESDLTRIVRGIIKENKGMKGCDAIITDMEYVFQDFMSDLKTSPGENDVTTMYDDLETELGGLLDEAYSMDCENIKEVELVYEELLTDFQRIVSDEGDYDEDDMDYYN